MWLGTRGNFFPSSVAHGEMSLQHLDVNVNCVPQNATLNIVYGNIVTWGKLFQW